MNQVVFNHAIQICSCGYIFITLPWSLVLSELGTVCNFKKVRLPLNSCLLLNSSGWNADCQLGVLQSFALTSILNIFPQLYQASWVDHLAPGRGLGDFLAAVLQDFKLQVLIAAVDYCAVFFPCQMKGKSSTCEIWKGNCYENVGFSSQILEIILQFKGASEVVND